MLTFDSSITLGGLSPILFQDDLVEREEFFTLTLRLVNANSPGIWLLPDEVNVTIIDEDGKLCNTPACFNVHVLQIGCCIIMGKQSELHKWLV